MHSIALSRHHGLAAASRSCSRIAANLGLIVLGSIIYVVGIKSVLMPAGFLSGGLVGITMILHYLWDSVDMGLVYFLLNIPLFLLGWFSIGRRFMQYTFAGIALFSLCTDLIDPMALHLEDPILAALLAGVICGAGGGIILRSLGSAGGLDILAVYLQKKAGLRVGTVYVLSNVLVLAAGAYLFDLEKALYSVIFVFISGKVVDAVMAGFNKRKSVLIVSDHSNAIAGRS